MFARITLKKDQPLLVYYYNPITNQMTSDSIKCGKDEMSDCRYMPLEDNESCKNTFDKCCAKSIIDKCRTASSDSDQCQNVWRYCPCKYCKEKKELCWQCDDERIPDADEILPGKEKSIEEKVDSIKDDETSDKSEELKNDKKTTRNVIIVATVLSSVLIIMFGAGFYYSYSKSTRKTPELKERLLKT